MASAPKNPGTLLTLFVASVFISSLQGALSAYNATVDWTTHPNLGTVHAVLHQLAPALALGSIRGCIIGFIVVAVVLIGNPLWMILGPFLASATAYIGSFVASVSAAVRGTKGESDSDTSKPQPSKA